MPVKRKMSEEPKESKKSEPEELKEPQPKTEPEEPKEPQPNNGSDDESPLPLGGGAGDLPDEEGACGDEAQAAAAVQCHREGQGRV